MKNRFAVSTLILLASVVCFSAQAQAAVLVVGDPPDHHNTIPFDPASNTITRYQQIYNANAFNPNPFIFNEIQFYQTTVQATVGEMPVTDPGAPFTIRTATYDIYFSTTSVGMNDLEGFPNFDNNLGADNALFFSGVLSGTIDPNEVFSILGNTFTYDPTQGNLLLDMKISNTQNNPSSDGALDAVGAFGPSSEVSRVADHCFPDGTPFFAACDPTVENNVFDGIGLVTGFNFQEQTTALIPEPSTLLLLGAGFAGLGIRRRNKK